MNYDMLLNAQYYELKKECKAAYQAWDKTSAMSLRYIGAEATARASIIAPNGIVVHYVGGEATGTVEVTENSLILSAPALTPVLTIDLTAAATDTIAELVAVIDALADWTCTKDAAMVGTELSKNLAIVAAQAAKASAYTCIMDRCLFIEAPNATGDVAVGPGGKIFLRALSYDTMTELVAFLDGLANYTCSLGTQMDGTELSTTMINVAAADILSAAMAFTTTANVQMMITIPPANVSKQITFTGFSGKSTYGSGTSTILVYNGATLAWSEAAGATTVSKESLLKKLTLTTGNALKVKVVNSVEMTAGEMSIAYEEKWSET